MADEKQLQEKPLTALQRRIIKTETYKAAKEELNDFTAATLDMFKANKTGSSEIIHSALEFQIAESKKASEKIDSILVEKGLIPNLIKASYKEIMPEGYQIKQELLMEACEKGRALAEKNGFAQKQEGWVSR